jgi:WD40 repeat protein
MSDVFLSYSRKDTGFVREIFESLSAHKREAWIDLHDIDYSSKWWEEICAGIDGADNFVLFVSQNSLESLFCQREIQYALKHNKRIIPFLISPIDQPAMFKAWQDNPDLSKFENVAHENWESIQAIQWIDYTQINEVDQGVAALLETVDSDPERVKLHTRLLLRLRDWDSRGRDPSGLLRGEDLALYEQWLGESLVKGTPPHPTDEQAAYITESRRAEDEAEAKRLQRERLVRRFRTAAAVLGGFFILAIVAAIVTTGIANRAVMAQQTAVARQGGANTQVAVIGQTLTPIPPTLTMVARTVVAGSYMIESLNLSAEANAILRTEGGNAETAALLGIRVLRKIYLPSADSALVEALNRLKSVPQVFSPRGRVQSVTFSPDGKTFLLGLASSPDNGGAELRDTASGNVLWTRPDGPPSINSVAFSPDGKLIVASGSDTTAMLWDAANGKTVRVLKGHTDVVQLAVFSPDNKNVLTLGGGRDLTARLWEIGTGRQIYSVPVGGGNPALFFFPDGQTFFAVDKTHLTSDGQPAGKQGVRGGVMALSPDGGTFVTGIRPTAELRDSGSGQVLRSFSGHTDSIISAAFSKDGKWLITGSRDNTARVWNTASGKLLLLLSANAGQVNSVAFSPDGTQVLTGSDSARLWSLIVDNPQQQTLSASAGISTFALAPDGKSVLIGDVNGNNGLWDLTTSQVRHDFPKRDADVKSVAFSPDGKLVAIPVCCDGVNATAEVYEVATWKLLKTFSVKSSQPFVGSLLFSSDSKTLLAANLDDSARLWDVASGKVLRQFNGKDPLTHPSPGFSPDGKLVVLDGGKLWWDISTGAQVNFPGEMNGYRIVFSADGSLAAIANNPGQPVEVWNVATKQLVKQVSAINSGVTSLAFSPDNRLLLTGSDDHTARLWEISTGRLLRVFNGHTAAVTGVAFMPDGHRIVTASLDGTLRTWITDYNDLVAYACSRVGTDLTPGERDHYGISDQEPTCPQFGAQSQPLILTTTPMSTRTPLAAWTPIPTPTTK